jgi:hypothetical protein
MLRNTWGPVKLHIGQKQVVARGASLPNRAATELSHLVYGLTMAATRRSLSGEAAAYKSPRVSLVPAVLSPSHVGLGL